MSSADPRDPNLVPSRPSSLPNRPSSVPHHRPSLARKRATVVAAPNPVSVLKTPSVFNPKSRFATQFAARKRQELKQTFLRWELDATSEVTLLRPMDVVWTFIYEMLPVYPFAAWLCTYREGAASAHNRGFTAKGVFI